ncbi:MAG: adenylyltransferase/cytidyltransferase family protein [Candidatus Wolfebacteria bacterium]|nr:adenylyltransferase/cytidyltransferase family protein [Candidatus Wolfebacteria bacterium]
MEKATKTKKSIIVAVSGGFDPIHVGHVRMFHEAKLLGDELVVILNNDNWLINKKGFFFMSEEERKEVLEGFRDVDGVVLTHHKLGDADRSVVQELRELRPDIFANGGDRKPDWDPVPEVALCEELGIEMVYNVGHGGKVQSSSWLLNKYMGEANCICGSGKKYKDCHGKTRE